MKRKHYAIIIILIILSTVSASAVQLLTGIGTGRSNGPLLIEPEKQVSISVPGKEAIKDMKRLEKVMARLINPSGVNSSRTQLGLFGYPKYKDGAAGTTGKETGLSPLLDYTLSLAFWGNEKRFCVINDRFYHEGASLPDGEIIVKIDRNRVLIKKHGFKSWITLEQQANMTNNLEESGDTM